MEDWTTLGPLRQVIDGDPDSEYDPDIFGLVDVNGYTQRSFGNRDRQSFFFATVNRFTCNSTLVWGRRRGADHIFLTHYRYNEDRTHLQILRKAPKRDVTVVLLAYAFYVDYQAYLDQWRAITERIQEGFGISGIVNLHAYYGNLQQSFTPVPFQDTLVFDTAGDLVREIKEIFRIEPQVWYLPISYSGYLEYRRRPNLYQLIASRVSNGVMGFSRRVQVEGTDYCLCL